MAETLHPIEQQSPVSEQVLTLLESDFGGYGFDEFQSLLAMQSPDRREQILSLIEAQRDPTTGEFQPDFRDYVEWEYLPNDEGTLIDFMAEFGRDTPSALSDLSVEADIATVEVDRVINQETIATAEEDVATAEEDVATAEEDVATGEAARERKEIETEAAELKMQRFMDVSQRISRLLPGEDIPGYEGLPDSLDSEYLETLGQINSSIQRYLEQNYVRILREIQSHSNTEFLALYQTFQELHTSGVVDFPELESPEFQELVALSQLALSPDTPAGPSIPEAARVAIDEGNIERIEGTIVFGNDGERVDFSDIPPVMTLEGGFEVGEVSYERNRELYQERARLEQELRQNQQEIQQNSEALLQLTTTQERYQDIPPESLDSEESRLALVRRIPSLGQQIENALSGLEVKTILLSYIAERIEETEQAGTILQAENLRINRELSSVGIRMESQQRRYRERMRERIERVKRTREFISEIQVLSMMPLLRELLGRVDESNPIVLENGNRITAINLDTLEMEGSFNPMLGQGGANDLSTRRVFAQVINKILTGDTSGPIVSEGSGNFSFMLDGDRVDATIFQNHVLGIIGNVAFNTRAVNNLFTQREED